MDFLAWNDAIGAHFFNPDKNGSRVFLYITKESVAEIGALHNADFNSFIGAVISGPPWNTRIGRGICQQALQAFEDWRSRSLNYPPYLNYLALFVIADSVDVGFARHAYYPGLRSLLGEEPKAGMYPSFDLMYRLWDDLAVWSNQDRQGEWGVFDADIVGEWMHVGLPRAQTLLTDRERGDLPFLFVDNGLDPLSPPSDRELTHLLVNDPNHYLRPRTKKLLCSTNESDSKIRTALVEILIDELESWNGIVPPRMQEGEQSSRSLGSLRLAMILDRTAKIMRFFLRCRSNCNYPDEGLKFTSEEIQQPLYCYENWQGWSTPLSISENQANNFDPCRLDWREGLTMFDYEHVWKAALHKRPIRIMVNAMQYGYDGFVEEIQMPRGKHFYLLTHNDYIDKVQTWGNECCESFTELESMLGLPVGWHIYSIENAISDAYLWDDFPFLALPTTVRIKLRGGLKLKGNQYFDFALPDIEITGHVDSVDVFCNNYRLNNDPETGLYQITSELRARRLIVEVRYNDETIRKKSLYAVDTFECQEAVSVAHLDKFGQRTEDKAAETCVGSIVDGYTSPEFNPKIFLPASSGNRVYLIGKNPGEILDCSKATISDDWHPVWAVQMQKRGKGIAVYCGRNPANDFPEKNDFNNRKLVKLWKDILWHKRKRIVCPSNPTLKSLWQRYMKVAQYVC